MRLELVKIAGSWRVNATALLPATGEYSMLAVNVAGRDEALHTLKVVVFGRSGTSSFKR